MNNISKTNITVKAKKATTNNTTVEYPKYFRDIVNKANRYSGATRKNRIGDLGALFTTFRNRNLSANQTVENWRAFYTERHPSAIETATQEVAEKFLEIVKAVNPNTKKLNLTTRAFIATWVEELIIDKTFNGLMAQSEVASALAQHNSMKLTNATSEEDSRGIDGYIGDVSISVKPASYKAEQIEAQEMVYYTIQNGNIVITN
jgi:hypothetical protein